MSQGPTTNPYMPSGMDRLSMMLMALGGGISSAANAGLSGWQGIGPGLSAYAGAMGQAQDRAFQRQQQDEMEAIRRRQIGMQEQEYADKRDERKRLREAAMGWTPSGSGPTPGFAAPAAQPTMGPGQDALKRGQEFTNYLTSKHGLSPVGAGGVVGGLYQESGFNPNAVGDGGTAGGLGQWRLDRRENLARFAQAQGKPVSDPYVQLDYLVSEMKGGDMGAQRAYAMLQQAKTPEEATTAMMHFFRPAGYTPANPQGGHGYAQRVQYAQQFGAPGGSSGLPQGDDVRADGSGTALPPSRGALAPPPAPPQVPRPSLPPEEAARIQQAVRTRQITPQQGDAEASRIVTDLWNRQQQQANQIWTQQNENWRFERGEAAKAEQWYPLTADDAKMFPGLDPSKAYQRNRKTGELKPVGGAQVQIDMGQKGATEFVKQRAEAYETKIRPQAQSAADEISSMHTIRQLLDAGAFTGVGAESGLLAARVGEFLGLPSEKAANTQALMGAAAERVLSAVKSLGANPSNADREYLEKAKGGSITFTEQGLRRILDIGERSARGTIRKHGEEVGRLRKLPGLSEMPEEYFQISETPDYATWVKANPLAPLASGAPPPTDRPPLATFGPPQGSPAPTAAPRADRPPLSTFGQPQNVPPRPTSSPPPMLFRPQNMTPWVDRPSLGGER